MPTTDKKLDGEEAVLAVIAEMPEKDRVMSERLHEIIKTNAPDLSTRTWYGMPAYTREGKIICFFRSSKKFGERYMTLGFNDSAKLDDGTFWPISYALNALSADVESEIAAIVKKAVS